MRDVVRYLRSLSLQSVSIFCRTFLFDRSFSQAGSQPRNLVSGLTGTEPFVFGVRISRYMGYFRPFQRHSRAQYIVEFVLRRQEAVPSLPAEPILGGFASRLTEAWGRRA